MIEEVKLETEKITKIYLKRPHYIHFVGFTNGIAFINILYSYFVLDNLWYVLLFTILFLMTLPPFRNPLIKK